MRRTRPATAGRSPEAGSTARRWGSSTDSPRWGPGPARIRGAPRRPRRGRRASPSPTSRADQRRAVGIDAPDARLVAVDAHGADADRIGGTRVAAGKRAPWRERTQQQRDKYASDVIHWQAASANGVPSVRVATSRGADAVR